MRVENDNQDPDPVSDGGRQGERDEKDEVERETREPWEEGEPEPLVATAPQPLLYLV